ncbi:MAG TPA: hypothetical protein VFB15_11385 [Candidatus Binataceae bacterium]|jgi:hypothetical protein|nr:hypothetical protein [Candidatus Binataceae bacterium]
MKQKTLIEQLTRLRELELRAEVNQLKEHDGRIAMLETAAAQARSRASDCVTAGAALRELASMGELRLDCARRAAELRTQTQRLHQRVYRAHQRAEAANSARDEMVQTMRRTEHHRDEHESDQFFNWRRVNDRR